MSSPESPAKKRGRETAADMVRSLGIVMVLVLLAYWLAQPPESDKAVIRVIDPAVEIMSFTRAVPEAVVPGTLPAQWRPTVAAYDSSPDRLRIGYNTPTKEYAEYFASAGDREDFLLEAAGRTTEKGTVVVSGTTWQQLDNSEGVVSLVRTAGPLTVVVGGIRSTTTLDELRVLAASLTARTPRG